MSVFSEHKILAEEMGALSPYITSFEMILTACYALCLAGIQLAFRPHIVSLLRLLEAFFVFFGIYFLMKGLGLLSHLRLHPLSRFSHPLTSPASISAFASLCILMAGAASFWRAMGAVCACVFIACPLSIVLYWITVADPLKVSEAYHAVESRALRKIKKSQKGS